MYLDALLPTTLARGDRLSTSGSLVGCRLAIVQKCRVRHGAKGEARYHTDRKNKEFLSYLMI